MSLISHTKIVFLTQISQSHTKIRILTQNSYFSFKFNFNCLGDKGLDGRFGDRGDKGEPGREGEKGEPSRCPENLIAGARGKVLILIK